MGLDRISILEFSKAWVQPRAPEMMHFSKAVPSLWRANRLACERVPSPQSSDRFCHSAAAAAVYLMQIKQRNPLAP